MYNHLPGKAPPVFLLYLFDLLLMKHPIRVVIADDHEIFRDGFKNLFKNISEIELAGEAGNGKELVELVHNIKPDVVITDIQMEPMSGIEATRYITANFPEVKVIALAMFNEISNVIDMINAGAQGYLLKETDKADILEAILQVLEGKNYYCSDTRQKLKKVFAAAQKSHVADPAIIGMFTDKELEIIRLTCQEYSCKQIGPLINLNTRTVEGYRDQIKAKMGVDTVVGIVTYALRYHIFDHEE